MYPDYVPALDFRQMKFPSWLQGRQRLSEKGYEVAGEDVRPKNAGRFYPRKGEKPDSIGRLESDGLFTFDESTDVFVTSSQQMLRNRLPGYGVTDG